MMLGLLNFDTPSSLSNVGKQMLGCQLAMDDGGMDALINSGWSDKCHHYSSPETGDFHKQISSCPQFFLIFFGDNIGPVRKFHFNKMDYLIHSLYYQINLYFFLIISESVGQVS